MYARDSSAWTKLRLAVVGSLAAGALIPAPARSAVPAVPSTTSPEMRVAAIGYRLASRNASRCARLAPLTGLLLHDRSAYPAAVRDEIAGQYGLGEGIGVLGVVTGSPADRAGLKSGDEVVGIGGTPLADMRLPAPAVAASYARIEAFVAALAQRLQQGPVAITLRDEARSRTMRIAPEFGCAAAFALVPGDKPEAWSDAHYAAVTQALARAAGDDELAFALAHEMAHVVLGHAGEPHGPLIALGIGGKRSRERERAADRLGIAMVLGAGYDPAGAEALLARFSRASGPGFSLTHPSVQARLKAIREEAARIGASSSAE